jgi:LysM repeat protein
MKSTLLLVTLATVIGLPKASAATEIETLRASVEKHDQRIRMLENKVLILETSRAGQCQAPAADSSAAATPDHDTYTVKPGDSIERIARRHQCSATSLAQANGLKASAIIHPGQKLKLPGKTTAQAPAPKTAPAQAKAETPAPATAAQSHKIRPGETYSSIARKYKIPVATLIAANPGVKPTALRPGQEIRLSSATPANRDVRPLANAVARESAKPLSNTATVNHIPQGISAPSSAQPVSNPAPAPATLPDATQEKRIRSVTIDNEMTYAEFAAKHGTDTGRLNDLNGLDLTNATVLAKGSELYVPAQP